MLLALVLDSRLLLLLGIIHVGFILKLNVSHYLTWVISKILKLLSNKKLQQIMAKVNYIYYVR